MVQYINKLICIFMNDTENRKTKRKNHKKNTKDRFRVVPGVQRWVKNIVWSITDVSSSYNMTAFELHTTIPFNCNCFLLFSGFGGLPP